MILMLKLSVGFFKDLIKEWDVEDFIMVLYISKSCFACKRIQNLSSHLYFNRIPCLWNALPVINVSSKWSETIKCFMSNHFISNYNPDNSFYLHFFCPCATCQSKPTLHNFNDMNIVVCSTCLVVNR